MSQHSVDEPQDDAATVVSMPINPDTMMYTPSTPVSETDVHVKETLTNPGCPPEGLEDQTNFLPTKQVVMVFMGLSIALACSMLDQTMYVSCSLITSNGHPSAFSLLLTAYMHH